MSEFETQDLGFLATLSEVIRERDRNRSKKSYTTDLLERGVDHIAQKVGEEAVETVIASRYEDPTRLIEESADLMFHLMVLLHAKGKSLDDVIAVLRDRHR